MSEEMPVLSDYSEKRDYPDMPRSVPMHWLSNDHAIHNHSQTLKRLKERGGLSVQELWCNITGASISAIWNKKVPDTAGCIKFLNDKLNDHD